MRFPAGMSSRRFSIGRANDCDVVVADPSVSRRHAELELGDAQPMTLVDCQSTHGTHVVENGQARRVSRAVVSPQQQIQLGEVTLSVGELLDALRVRYPALGLLAQTPPNLTPERDDGRRRLVRCACGVIKAKGATCPGCGQ